jgi:hypothetical protein
VGANLPQREPLRPTQQFGSGHRGGAAAGAFWSLVLEKRDDLRSCGSSVLYTFLKVLPHSRGNLLRHEQWHIDEQSVVSFGGIVFADSPS